MNSVTLKILLIADGISEAARIRNSLFDAPGRKFSVQHVRALAQGLALLKTERFDAVLVDLELPGSTGLEAALAVREKSAAVPVVALATNIDDELAALAHQMDLQDCLVKDEFSGPQLARTIDSCIRRKRDSDLLRSGNKRLELHIDLLEEQILELKRTQIEAEELGARFHNLYHFAPVGYLTIDEKGEIIEGNELAASLLGWKKRSLAGHLLQAFFAVESWMTLHKLRRDIRSSTSPRRCEVRLRSGAGAEWAKLEGVLTAGGAEEREKYLIALHDITERKRADEKIARLNEALSIQAAELKKANKELEAFNYMVAHDLQQPLNLTFLSCQAIKAHHEKRSCAEFQAQVDCAIRGVDRMSRLIDTLLKFSISGTVALKRKVVDLSETARLVSVGLKATAPERRAIFHITEGIRVEGDPDLLRVVLDNLIGNAWKFTMPREEAVIAFGTTKVGGKAAYFVRDNGVGFEMAQAGKLFTPFARLSAGKQCKGFGIGLATVEKIILRHRGRVWAEGAPEKGATFYFTLPGGQQDSPHR